MFETEYKGQESDYHEHKADKAVMGEQRSNDGVPFSHDGDFVGNKVTQRIVIDSSKDVPVDVFGERDVLFLFLVPLDGVEFREDHRVEENYTEHTVEVACRQDNKEGHDHVNCSPGTLVKVCIQF